MSELAYRITLHSYLRSMLYHNRGELEYEKDINIELLHNCKALVIDLLIIFENLLGGMINILVSRGKHFEP
jgi:hypothetical protein